MLVVPSTLQLIRWAQDPEAVTGERPALLLRDQTQVLPTIRAPITMAMARARNLQSRMLLIKPLRMPDPLMGGSHLKRGRQAKRHRYVHGEMKLLYYVYMYQHVIRRGINWRTTLEE